jgi:glycosyltransferase involved in cell wall biosynthesis
MKISIILDNYNYADYLSQAIDSVLIQAYKNFELIIVDDGSTDLSHKIIEEHAAKDARIRPVFKSNGGQASAFNAGFLVSSGDIVCFLDSDDYFMPTKLEEIAALHTAGYEYVHSNHRSVDGNDLAIADNIKRFRYDGQCAFLVYYMSKYPGNVTSTISLSKRLANEIFPLPYEDEWRIQADDTIVFQAAMMGRAKYLDKKLTNYRIHDSNGHYGKKRSSDYSYELLKKRNKLKETVFERCNITKTFLQNGYNLVAEFKTHEIVDGELLKLYLKTLIFEMNIPIFKKVETAYQLLKIYKSRKNHI